VTNLQPDVHDPIFQNIRDNLHIFGLDHFKEINDLYNKPEEEIETKYYRCRERELWKPILVLAKYFGVLSIIKPYAERLIGIKVEEDVATTKELRLLEVLHQLVSEPGEYTVESINDKMFELFGDDFEVTSTWIGKTLSKQFGFTRRGKKGTKRTWILNQKAVDELCLRYGLDIDDKLQKSLSTDK
jgi:hypothetical protein